MFTYVSNSITIAPTFWTQLMHLDELYDSVTDDNMASINYKLMTLYDHCLRHDLVATIIQRWWRHTKECRARVLRTYEPDKGWRYLEAERRWSQNKHTANTWRTEEHDAVLDRMAKSWAAVNTI